MSNAVLKAAVLAVLVNSQAYAQDAPLRSITDEGRNRVYVLGRDGVAVLDARTRAKVAEVALPGWTWAAPPFACPPDMALGAQGELVVTSNVLPTLWRVDPSTLSVSTRTPILWEERDKDIGFTAIAWSPAQNAYFVSDDRGSKWRLDPYLGRALRMPRAAASGRPCE